MQEIKKRRIVIASVLKPVDDTRMFEKMAQSLAADADVHVIGYPAKGALTSAVTRHALKPFGRLSVGRLAAAWAIGRKVLALRPAVFIFTTHELLLVALVAKLLRGCRVVYDVQENYFRNILYTEAFPLLLRPWLALYVRAKEWLCAPAIDHFLLAEQGYANEFGFARRRSTVVENKLRKPDGVAITNRSRTGGTLHLLFSGTLSASTGVFVALDLAEKLHAVHPAVRLTVIGYCAQPETLKTIRTRISCMPYVVLKGGDALVPHGEILKEVLAADAGIISYPPNRATENAIPTKLYEYLGCLLPILIIDHAPWVAWCDRFQAGVPFQPGNLQPAALLQALQTKEFYTLPPDGVYWESEATKLQAVIKTLA